MAEGGKPRSLCDDGLDPLASGLLSIAQRFGKPFDVAKLDRMDGEYRSILEQAGHDEDRLTEAQRKRLSELSEQMESQAEPPRALDVDSLYTKYRIEQIIDWLKINISVEYADDFKRTLLGVKERFSALEFKASQIINGDLGKETTVYVRYAIQHLIERHINQLREQFPNHDYHPERDEMTEALRTFEIEILDEYTEIGNQLRDVGNHLRRVSALIRVKMKQPVVRAALRTKKSKSRSGPKATYEKIQSEASLVTKWNKARESGVHKPEFAKDNDMTAKDLNRLLDRVAQRKKRSENYGSDNGK